MRGRPAIHDEQNFRPLRRKQGRKNKGAPEEAFTSPESAPEIFLGGGTRGEDEDDQSGIVNFDAVRRSPLVARAGGRRARKAPGRAPHRAGPVLLGRHL